jgi:hypothetical protein
MISAGARQLYPRVSSMVSNFPSCAVLAGVIDGVCETPERFGVLSVKRSGDEAHRDLRSVCRDQLPVTDHGGCDDMQSDAAGAGVEPGDSSQPQILTGPLLASPYVRRQDSGYECRGAVFLG